jgi:hypothetical protein
MGTIILKSKLREILERLTANIYELDSKKYPYTSKEIVKSKLKFNWLEGLFYRSDVNDCDDYAIRQMSRMRKYGVGLVFSNSHAFNIFVDDKKEIYLIEPQTGKVLDEKTFKSNKLYYPIQLILI